MMIESRKKMRETLRKLTVRLEMGGSSGLAYLKVPSTVSDSQILQEIDAAYASLLLHDGSVPDGLCIESILKAVCSNHESWHFDMISADLEWKK